MMEVERLTLFVRLEKQCSVIVDGEVVGGATESGLPSSGTPSAVEASFGLGGGFY